MKVATAGEMRAIDRKAIDEYGIQGDVLMERAGLSVSQKIRELFEKRKVIVLSGGGNNGGDGIVAARDLFNRGWNVKLLLLAREGELSPGCLSQFKTARKMGVPMEFRTVLRGADLHSAVVVDAIFGTGLSRPPGSPHAEIIGSLNKSGAPVISVDIPSGISSDTGQAMGEAVRADYTVTFGLPKIGHFIHPGAEYSGKLFVEDIGFPRELLSSEALKVQTIGREEASALIPERPAYSHKGDYGHVLIVAGSEGKTGAALMSANACLRSGAGMVTMGVPETLAGIFQSRVTEEMVLPLPDTGSGVLSATAAPVILDFLGNKADVLAIGPGLTAGPGIVTLLSDLLPSVTVPMVIDADALNGISGQTGLLKKMKAPAVLTPHPGEMARLLNQQSGKAIEQNRINTARSFSKETGVYLVLKGAPTVIAEQEGMVFINTTGNPGMATAGTGDVLTGIISGLIGQGLAPLDASVLGPYLHGLAGDIAASQKGMHSVVAGDIIENLPEAFRELRTT